LAIHISPYPNEKHLVGAADILNRSEIEKKIEARGMYSGHRPPSLGGYQVKLFG
jgi:hypothetical protein